MPAEEIFTRSPKNPVLEPGDLPFRAVAVLNPGAADRCIGLATARIDDLLNVPEG
jgi:predicted GH43/DUF377 family glycosyl hydrolase